MSVDWILVATTESDKYDAVIWKKFTSYKYKNNSEKNNIALQFTL